MTEEDDVKVKWLKTEYIPVDKIKMSELQARQKEVTAGLELFAEQIRNVGLIQPIVVYQKGNEYELLVGQRRYLAHRDVLEWKEIRAEIIKRPEDDMMATTISWLENHARKKMANKDTLRHVARMLGEGMTAKQVGSTLGMSAVEVNRAKQLPSVPDVVREAVESGKLSIKNAIKATIAKRFEKHETPESKGDDVLDMALKMDPKKLSDQQLSNIGDYVDEHPDANNDEILDQGVVTEKELITVDLSSSENKRLVSYQKNNDKTSRSAAARDLILDGLTEAGV